MGSIPSAGMDVFFILYQIILGYLTNWKLTVSNESRKISLAAQTGESYDMPL